MKKGTRIKLTKVNRNLNYEYEGLNLGYLIIGTLESDIKIDEVIHVRREIRNNIKIPGIFISSIVKKINGNEIKTINSIYKLEEIK